MEIATFVSRQNVKLPCKEIFALKTMQLGFYTHVHMPSLAFDCLGAQIHDFRTQAQMVVKIGKLYSEEVQLDMLCDIYFPFPFA